MFSFNLSAIPVDARIGAALQCIDIIYDMMLDDPALVRLTETIRESARDVTTALGPYSDRKTMHELNEFDFKRDEAFRSLFFLIKGYSHHCFDASLRKPLHRIFHDLNEQGLAFLEGTLIGETHEMAAKLEYLRRPYNVKVLERLDLMKHLEYCEETNRHFEELYNTIKAHTKQSPIALRDAVVPFNKALRSLRIYLASEYDHETALKCLKPLLDALGIPGDASEVLHTKEDEKPNS